MKQRQAVTKKKALTYRGADRAGKSRILAELIESAGPHRDYVRAVLQAPAGKRLAPMLAANALAMAIETRSPRPGTVIYLEYGIVSPSWIFTQRAREAGRLLSMGAVGSGYNNSTI